jgi:hypothetical protein
LKDTSQLDRIGIMGHKYVLKKFNEKEMGKKINQEYQKLLNKNFTKKQDENDTFFF